ncbi:calcium/sodium antiporter [Desulfosarcina cetonica]
MIFFSIGLCLLYYGAGWLVQGAASLARSLGLTPMVIGLTVVAFGTSAPELVVSMVSAFKAKSMIALGNVVGSNICNIALVLGLTAVFQPVTTSRTVIRRDIPLMLAISVFLFLLSLNSVISRAEGVMLFAGVVAYTGFNYKVATRVDRTVDHPKPPATETSPPDGLQKQRWRQGLMVAGGITTVVVGAELLVDAAVRMMTALGVNEKFVGLTVVAFGTSVPELATSVMAAVRKEMDISLGNLVGSNVFNLLSVVGASAMIRPITIPGGFVKSGLIVDYLVMMIISLLPWLMMRQDLTISRRKGLILVGCYVLYVIFLIFKS